MSSTMLATHDVYGGVPSAGSYRRPSFWSKRKKTGLSLLSILALVAGIAIAFKLFDRAVPNNVVRDAAVFNFEIYKQEAALGDTDWVLARVDPASRRVFGMSSAVPSPVDLYPGDTRSVDVKLENMNEQPARDATFYVYVTNVRVRSCLGLTETGECTGVQWVDATTGPGQRFVSFWNFEVDREQILVAAGQEFRDGSFTTTCSGSIREFTAANPCDLGRIKAAGTTNDFDQRLDERLYEFKVEEIDDGTDQSEFKGWEVFFNLVFQARVPAVPDSVTLVGYR